MYELLTGSLPFKGENAVEIALKQMKESIPSIREKNPTIPQSIENIVLKACAKNPKNRYDSVSEMHHDLKAALLNENKECERLVYKYPEHEDLDVTKTLPTLANINEISKQPLKEKKELEEKKEEPMKKEVEKEEIDKGDKQIKWLIIIFCIFIALVIGIVAITGVLLVNHSKSKVITLPVISDKTSDEAIEELEKLGIEVEIKEENSDDVPEGDVIGYQGKKEGYTKVKKGTTVTIVVSVGPSGFLLDDYSGKNIEVVEKELKNKGIQVVKTQKKVDEENFKDEQGNKKEVFEGMIVNQDKPKGTRLNEGDVIELYYAVLIVTYPDFTYPEEGYTREKIQTFCDDNSINCEFKEIERDDVEPGTILSQNREKDVEVRAGVSLRIEIAVELPKYDVTFNTNGGAPVISKQSVKKGSTATEPATKPTKTGYNFSGWYLNGSLYNFSTAVTENITLEAKWTEIKERN